MRYIAKKQKDNYLIQGLQFKKTEDGKEYEVIIDDKEYDKKKLEDFIKDYSQERDLMIEKYNNELDELKKILEAINKC